MAAPPNAAMLARPAALVVLQCAITMADEARDTAITLLHARDDDPDAVHDFRVAVRRLRSWLQLWRDELDAVVSRRQRRRIRDLAHATGPARDLQVHLEWLRGEEASATGRALADVEHAIADLMSRRPDAMIDVRRAARQFIKRHVTLSRRLSAHSAELEDAEHDSTFGAALAEQVETTANAFRDRLATVHGAARDEELHLARIAAKRLRYLVERAEDAVVGVPAMVRDLKQFQDLAGDAHDVHVFSKELRVIFKKFGARGRGALDVRLRQRGAKAYSALAQRWLGDESAGFFRRTATVASRLRAGAR
ncbi:MAG TPA: CHAD domain-containing protein [Gemmatimonadaceae bacterium]